jgi:hypothetical protein
MVDKEKISAIISRNARLAPSLPAMPERLLAYITTRRFPSWNDILKVDRRAAVAIKQKARETGRQAAAAWAKGEGFNPSINAISCRRTPSGLSCRAA